MKASNDVRGIEIIIAAIKVDFFATSETITITTEVINNLIK